MRANGQNAGEQEKYYALIHICLNLGLHVDPYPTTLPHRSDQNIVRAVVGHGNLTDPIIHAREGTRHGPSAGAWLRYHLKYGVAPEGWAKHCIDVLGGAGNG